MLQTLTFVNPITEEEVTWNIEITNLEYKDWQDRQYEQQSSFDSSTGDKLESILDKLNPTLYKGEVYFGTNTNAYKNLLSDYFKILYTINNCLLYNYYVEVLIDKIRQNIKYEYWAKMKEFTHKSVQRTTSRNTSRTNKMERVVIKNEWIKHETKDMFTGETVYLYENLKTGETQESKDPNLLVTLNGVKKKEKPIVKIELKFI